MDMPVFLDAMTGREAGCALTSLHPHMETPDPLVQDTAKLIDEALALAKQVEDMRMRLNAHKDLAFDRINTLWRENTDLATDADDVRDAKRIAESVNTATRHAITVLVYAPQHKLSEPEG